LTAKSKGSFVKIFVAIRNLGMFSRICNCAYHVRSKGARQLQKNFCFA